MLFSYPSPLAASAAAGSLTHTAPEMLLSSQMRAAGDVYAFGIIST